MKLTISPAVQEKITALQQTGDRILLDFEDGIGPFVEAGASCQLYPNFRLLLVSQGYPASLKDYDVSVASEIGPIYLKGNSVILLDEEVRLVEEQTYQRVQVTSDSGILVNNLPIKRVEGETYGAFSSNQRPSC